MYEQEERNLPKSNSYDAVYYNTIQLTKCFKVSEYSKFMYLSRCTTPHQSTIFTFGHKQFQFHLSVTDKNKNSQILNIMYPVVEFPCVLYFFQVHCKNSFDHN